MGWTHLASIINQCPADVTIGQSAGGSFSTEILSSQAALVCVKSMKPNQYNSYFCNIIPDCPDLWIRDRPDPPEALAEKSQEAEVWLPKSSMDWMCGLGQVNLFCLAFPICPIGQLLT